MGAVDYGRVRTSFDVVTPWQGWPIPTAQYDGGDPVWYVLYPYDPQFKPGAVFNVGNFNPMNVYGAFGPEDCRPVAGRLQHEPGLNLATEAGLADVTRPLNVGGSARPNTPIHGRQYWEVEIVALPGRVPPAQMFTWLADFPPYTSWYATIEPIESDVGPLWGTQLYWPPGLNTFLSPTIGLWPVDPTFGKTNLIGLDDPAAKARSIGVTRTSALYQREYTTNQGEGDGPYALLMEEGAKPTIDARFPGVFPNPEFFPDTGSAPSLTGDVFNAPDINPYNDSIAAPRWGVTLPFSMTIPPLGAVLRAAPLFKGRADWLLSIKAPRNEVNKGGPFPGGVWTGVDIGGFGVGDRLMFATDTFLRRFWIGKNGRWYPDGGPPDGEPSCYLDGLGSNYYPGCSTRIGPTTLRFVFGAKDLAYPIPKAFRPYAGQFLYG